MADRLPVKPATFSREELADRLDLTGCFESIASDQFQAARLDRPPAPWLAALILGELPNSRLASLNQLLTALGADFSQALVSPPLVRRASEPVSHDEPRSCLTFVCARNYSDR
jgi:hypothetical protein